MLRSKRRLDSKPRLSLASQPSRFRQQTLPSPETPGREIMLGLDDTFLGSVDLDKVEKAYWDSQKKTPTKSQRRNVNCGFVSPLLFESDSSRCQDLPCETPPSSNSARKDNAGISPVQRSSGSHSSLRVTSQILESIFPTTPQNEFCEQNNDEDCFSSSPILGGSFSKSIQIAASAQNEKESSDLFSNSSQRAVAQLSDSFWEDFEASAYEMDIGCVEEIFNNGSAEEPDEQPEMAESDEKMEEEGKKEDLDMVLDYTVYVNSNNAAVPCTDETIKEVAAELKLNCTSNPNNTVLKDLGISKLNWSEETFDAIKNVSHLQKQGSFDFNEQMKERLLGNARKQVTLKTSILEDKIKTVPKDASFYGLSENVFKLIQKYKGIKDLYEWQKKCLSLPAVTNHSNLIYALPTSGGKTLVAEVLVLKEILLSQKNAIFVLPFVSIVQEKVRALSPFGLELNFFIEEYASNRGVYPPRKRRKKNSVFIATIEKALGLINSLISENRLDEIGLVVVDELHLIGEDLRGATLEILITKLLVSHEQIQIVGMSATIGNLDELATFLRAETFTEDFRPVELKEYVKCGNQLCLIDRSKRNFSESIFTLTRTYEANDQAKKSGDPDLLGVLVMEVVPQESVLIFCPTRKNCENVSLLICENMSKDLLTVRKEEKLGLYRALLAEGNGRVCPTLKRTLPFGVAYHHSGLTTAERRLLEEAFLAKTVCVICCTSTLAAGVNLPARRVILRAPYVGNGFIDLARYKQMIGRAGRTGLGEAGESIIICPPADVQRVQQLMSSSIEETISKLDMDNEGQGISVLVLSSIELQIAASLNDVHNVLSQTLLSVQATKKGVDLRKLAEDALKRLIEEGGVEVKDPPESSARDEKNAFSVVFPKTKETKWVYPDSGLSLSRLGKGAVKASQTLAVARRLHEDLSKAQQNCVLVSHLHLLYLVTPYSLAETIKPNTDAYYEAYMSLSKADLHTAEIIGITEAAAMSIRSLRSIKSVSKDVVHRFYVSLMMYDLWREKSVWDVAVKYQVTRGQVYTLMTTVPSFASAVLRFSEDLQEFWCFKNLLADMTTRLAHFCCLELQPLMELPSVKIGRARQLFQAGYTTIRDIATADPIEIARSLDHMPRKVAHEIVSTARLMLVAKAETLQEEAEVVLEGIAQHAL